MSDRKVRNLTTERARRGQLPWTFTIDVAADRFHIEIFKGAGPFDGLAMAGAADAWAKTLRKMARELRRIMKESG
jgi:hypothetical protein